MKLLIKHFHNIFFQSTHNMQQNFNFYYDPVLTNLKLNKALWIYLLVSYALTQNYTHTRNYHSLSFHTSAIKGKNPKRDAETQHMVSGMVIIQQLASHAPHLNCTAPGKGRSISHRTGEFQVSWSVGWNST